MTGYNVDGFLHGIMKMGAFFLTAGLLFSFASIPSSSHWISVAIEPVSLVHEDMMVSQAYSEFAFTI